MNAKRIKDTPVPRDAKAADFVSFEKAPAAVGRSKRTIYAWMQEGIIRSINLTGTEMLFMPDLAEAKARKKRGRPRSGESG